MLTGGTAAVVNFGTRILYDLRLDFSTSVIFAHITGMITAFVLAKTFVFKESQQPAQRAAFFFVLVNLATVLQTWAISMAFAYYLLPTMRITLFNSEIAHAVGITVPVFTSYISHKRWSFR